jgi:predicted nuclease with TOPRIM domain
LGIIKTERAQKKEMEQLYIYMDNCDDQLKAEQDANVYINKLFTEMESEANRLKDKYNNELIEHAKTKEQLKIQKDRKKKWRGLAIGSGIVNIVLIYLISK